jgi:hypothetical protein
MNKNPGTVNRPIHVGLGGEMHHRIRLGDQPIYEVCIADISMDESQPWIINHWIEVCSVTRVCQGIENGHRRNLGRCPTWRQQ